MPNADSLITTGGLAGLLIAATYVGRLVLEWLRERRKVPVEDRAARVGDAATANAVLVQSLKSLQDENERLQSRVKHLEAEDRRKDVKITELEGQLARIAAELAALRSH